ncbi:hypothetical protein Y1Q_0005120 [Alligator mississippiensis]|uniref:Uncharacterized protein n=1 Tax=Alligator mississippiensis TaxID=8496 RepID=A0A151MUE1_ALLMI|nr:hypothetical protein Y1Q_0005120 [Alligator mississippiensis]
MLDRKNRQHFLLAIISMTIAADQSREVAVELEGLKADLLKRIMDLMENISVEADPKHILAYSIDAIRCLSDLKLSLEPALESCLLWAAVDKSFLAIGCETHHNQVMQQLYEEYLEGLLCCVLSSAPSLGKLYSMWEAKTCEEQRSCGASARWSRARSRTTGTWRGWESSQWTDAHQPSWTCLSEKEIPIRVLNKIFIITCLKELPKDLQGNSLLVTSSSALTSLQPPTVAPAGGSAYTIFPALLVSWILFRNYTDRVIQQVQS